MSAWLYQMSLKNKSYTLEQYRVDIWEGKAIDFPIRKCVPRGQDHPAPGDLLVLFWDLTKNSEPGVFGWGIVTSVNKAGTKLMFRPPPPSDYLKMAPCWDKEVAAVVEQIRGTSKMGTTFGIKPEEMDLMREKVARWTARGS